MSDATSSDLQAVSLRDFVNQSKIADGSKACFELESSQLLNIEVDGRVWTRIGAMVAYTGNIKFEREGMMKGGLSGFLKKTLTGEMTILSSATGRGSLYVADRSKHISLLRLNGEELNVQGTDLLAFEDSISYDIRMMKSIAGVMSGGLFYVNLSGTGFVAVTSHGRPKTLPCSRQVPLYTDPGATVAWSGNLVPNLKTDISIKSLVGRGGGESFQLAFEDDGFVVVQPCELIAPASR